MSPNGVDATRQVRARERALRTPGDTPSSPDIPTGLEAQERKRPLRTYGKRSARSEEVEPSRRKKQKLEDANLEDTKLADVVQPKSSPKLPPLPPPPQLAQLPQPEPPKRGSILSYFQRVPSGSSSQSAPSVQPIPSSDPIEPAPLTPPPSSPVLLSRARQRRRLTTRPAISADGPEAVDARTQASDTGGVSGVEGTLQDGTLDQEPDDVLVHNPDDNRPCEQRYALAEATPSAANDREPIGAAAEKTTREGKGKENRKRKPGKRPAKDMVQTTLSLSINPGPGFTVCRECGVLYNPLNEKDRKEHKKQHAAHIRGKAKGQGRTPVPLE